MKKKKLDVIRSSLLFAELPEDQLVAVAELAMEKQFERGSMIFFEGDPADGFYMVQSGKVKIFKSSLGGKEQILHIFGPGEPFGEVPVFHGQPFPATAMALEKSDLLYFPRRQFVELVSRIPSLALNMLAMLSLRLRRFTTQIENLSLKEVPGRLAAYLLYLAEEQDNLKRVELQIPKGQLASLLGTIPETLSRIFARMSEDGLIRVDGRMIYLEDPERLREVE